MNSGNIDWNDVFKKEARGNDDEDFGEVQDVQDNYVLVQKGIINKEKFYIPKDQAESYDGDVLRFRFSKEKESSHIKMNHLLQLSKMKELVMMIERKKEKLTKKEYH